MMREAQVFFELLAEGDSQAVKQLLDQALQEKANLKSGLCHPLCDCRKCTELFDKLVLLFSGTSHLLSTFFLFSL